MREHQAGLGFQVPAHLAEDVRAGAQLLFLLDRCGDDPTRQQPMAAFLVTDDGARAQEGGKTVYLLEEIVVRVQYLPTVFTRVGPGERDGLGAVLIHGAQGQAADTLHLLNAEGELNDQGVFAFRWGRVQAVYPQPIFERGKLLIALQEHDLDLSRTLIRCGQGEFDSGGREGLADLSQAG